LAKGARVVIAGRRSTQPAMTEEGKKLLFGQAAVSVAGTWWVYVERITP
jgi:hypothetical protein